MRIFRMLHILVSAGPTREPIDPVRFISNYSTGRAGYEIAKAALRKKYKTTLITGPTNLKPPAGAKLIQIETAHQLEKALIREFKRVDCLVMVAAVADFKPRKIPKKLKRRPNLRLELKANPDILAKLGRMKKKRILVGFCLETEGLIRNALFKLEKKNLDLIVAIKMDREESPFGDNLVSPVIIGKDKHPEKVALLSKSKLARLLINRIEKLTFFNFSK